MEGHPLKNDPESLQETKSDLDVALSLLEALVASVDREGDRFYLKAAMTNILLTADEVKLFTDYMPGLIDE